MKKLFTLFLSVMAALGTLQAAEFTYSFSKGVPDTWTSSAKPYGIDEDLGRGTQFTTSTTLTLKGVKQATKVVVTCSTNVDKKNTLGVKVGSTTFGKTETLGKAANATKTFEGTATDGDLIITFTRSEKSVYIQSVVLTCEEAPEGNGGDDEGLYDYETDEPITLNTTFATCELYEGTLQSGTAFSLLGLEDATGTTYAEIALFGELKAGTYKFDKSYAAGTALASFGYDEEEDYYCPSNVFYNLDEEGYGDVLYLMSGTVTVSFQGDVATIKIDAKSYYGSTFTGTYTGEMTSGSSGGSGDDDDDDDLGEISYDYEPTTKTTINQTFTLCEVSEGTDYEKEKETASIWLENDTYCCEIDIFAEIGDNGFVAAGTYNISNSKAEGTAYASPGGDNYYDYGTYLEQYNEEGKLEASYYIVSGTVTVSYDAKGNISIVLDGKSYNGSTIKASYTGDMNSYAYRYEDNKQNNVNLTFTDASYLTGVWDEDDETPYYEFFLENETSCADLMLIGELKTGTYEINNSEAVGTAFASQGYFFFSSIPCYVYDGYDEEEEQYSNAYYLVSGTIKVTVNGSNVKIEVDAKSYYGSTIKLTYSGTPEEYQSTAIETVKSEKSSRNGKIMQNGKLIINHNGRSYNAAGMIIK